MDVSVVTWKPQNEDGFFLLALSPQVRLDPRRTIPKDVLFVLDRSGRISGTKIRQARDALTFCLDRLEPSDRFAVVTFSSDKEPWWKELRPTTPETVREARVRTATIEAAGGTAIHDALLAALPLLKGSHRLAIVVFLTDGQSTVGTSDPDEILQAVRRANPGGVRLYVVGVGHDVHTYLLDRLAADHHGTQQYVGEHENLEHKLSAFFQTISHPRLTGVTIEAEGVELRDLYPRRMPGHIHRQIRTGSEALSRGRTAQGGGPRSCTRPQTNFHSRGQLDWAPRRAVHSSNFGCTRK